MDVVNVQLRVCLRGRVCVWKGGEGESGGAECTCACVCAWAL